MAEWRNKLNPKGRPTQHFNIITAKDFIRIAEIFTLEILHVVSIQGKGFYYIIDHVGTGALHLCTEENAYEKSLAEGEARLERAVKEANDEYEETIRRNKELSTSKKRVKKPK